MMAEDQVLNKAIDTCHLAGEHVRELVDGGPEAGHLREHRNLCGKCISVGDVVFWAVGLAKPRAIGVERDGGAGWRGK